MRIAVNARLLLPGRRDGISNFARETLSRITRRHREHQFVFLFDRPFSEEFLYADNIQPVVLFPPARHALLTTYLLERAVPRALEAFNPHLFLSPDGWLSLRLATPSLPVIHDLNFEAEGYFLPLHLRLFYRGLFPRYARKATRIATVSHFSKQDLHTIYGVPEDKIDVVYNGVGGHFRPLPADKIQQVRRRVSDGQPYFVMVGGLYPRKNVADQIRAFQRLGASGLQPTRLVIAGETKWAGREVDALLGESGGETIKALGTVSNEEMALVIGSATALCHVSAYEGFGVPTIEAMRAGVPVITSDTTAMPEICGDAALLVNPRSVDAIQQAMARLLQDDSLRQTLIERGLERSRRYCWDKTAGLLWESIEKALTPRSLPPCPLPLPRL